MFSCFSSFFDVFFTFPRTLLTFSRRLIKAIAADSYHQTYNRRMARGTPIPTALAESEFTLSGTTYSPSQEHFYLETQACIAVPKLESGEMEIISSTQALTETQHYVAQVTGVPRSRIVAKCKRMGGGFGGKESRTTMLAAVCATAAKKLRRPVRCMLERHEDIKISGQRHPFKTEWKVGFTREGKLTALEADFFANAGYSLDISGGVADRAIAHATNSYYIPNVDVRAKLCKTNTVSNTAYRGCASSSPSLPSSPFRFAAILTLPFTRLCSRRAAGHARRRDVP